MPRAVQPRRGGERRGRQPGEPREGSAGHRPAERKLLDKLSRFKAVLKLEYAPGLRARSCVGDGWGEQRSPLDSGFQRVYIIGLSQKTRLKTKLFENRVRQSLCEANSSIRCRIGVPGRVQTENIL